MDAEGGPREVKGLGGWGVGFESMEVNCVLEQGRPITRTAAGNPGHPPRFKTRIKRTPSITLSITHTRVMDVDRVNCSSQMSTARYKDVLKTS